MSGSKPSGVVSIVELAKELRQHNDTPDMRMLIEQLRTRAINLKEFCKRVRLLMGPQGEHVLKACVEGLQRAQRMRQANAQGGEAAASGPPSSAASSAGGGAPPADEMAMPPLVPQPVKREEGTISSSSSSQQPAAADEPAPVLAPPPPPAILQHAPSSDSSIKAPSLPSEPSPLMSPPAADGEKRFFAEGKMGSAGASSSAAAVDAPPPVATDPAAVAASAPGGGSAIVKSEGSSSGGGGGGGAGPPSAGRQRGSETKVLVHALLCPRIYAEENEPNSCSFTGCNQMKRVLRRVEMHTQSCSMSNLPGGQGDCTTCNKPETFLKPI